MLIDLVKPTDEVGIAQLNRIDSTANIRRFRWMILAKKIVTLKYA